MVKFTSKKIVKICYDKKAKWESSHKTGYVK